MTMGKTYVQHSDMCGCERCAIQADNEHPRPVYDLVEDPDILDCGCSAIIGCTCYDYYDPYEDMGDATMLEVYYKKLLFEINTILDGKEVNK